MRHGCFNGADTPAVISGAGYTVIKVGRSFNVSFTPAVGTGSYTVLLDGRTSTGRALAITASGSVDTSLTFTPGWLDADGETINRICFMLAR